jgi:hypothetical protein
MVNTVETIARRNVDFKTNKVGDILPEYFIAQYPQFITFLEKYYDYLDSDETYNFDRQIKELFAIRDIHSNSTEDLDRIFKEIGLGIANSNYFKDPRYAARLLSIFYRVKGSLYSSEAFFKAFYGIDAEIQYPKKNLFIVGDSLIGPESLKFIQDGALYQVYSILVKSEIPIVVWKELFKQFVHPAGFYLGSEVVFTGVANNFATVENIMPNVTPAINVGNVTFTSSAAMSIEGAIDLTELIQSDSAGVFIRTNPYDYIEAFSSITIAQLDAMYQTIGDLVSINPFSFDEDSDGAGRTMDMSNTTERFDQVKYKWYDSDSA